MELQLQSLKYIKRKHVSQFVFFLGSSENISLIFDMQRADRCTLINTEECISSKVCFQE